MKPLKKPYQFGESQILSFEDLMSQQQTQPTHLTVYALIPAGCDGDSAYGYAKDTCISPGTTGGMGIN